MRDILNNDMKNITESLRCNKLSRNVSKAHYLVFSHRNKNISYWYVKINNRPIEWVFDTKFIGVQNDA